MTKPISAKEYREHTGPSRKSKYGAKRTMVDGVLFDSKAEMSEKTLRRCPFCGGGTQFIFGPTCAPDSKYDRSDRAYPIVKCSGCNAEAHGDNWDKTGRSAIEAWNRRHQEQETTSEFERLLSK